MLKCSSYDLNHIKGIINILCFIKMITFNTLMGIIISRSIFYVKKVYTLDNPYFVLLEKLK